MTLLGGALLDQLGGHDAALCSGQIAVAADLLARKPVRVFAPCTQSLLVF